MIELKGVGKSYHENIDYTIRELRQNEVKILDIFLYEAIFIPEGVTAPSRDIIK